MHRPVIVIPVAAALTGVATAVVAAVYLERRVAAGLARVHPPRPGCGPGFRAR